MAIVQFDSELNQGLGIDIKKWRELLQERCKVQKEFDRIAAILRRLDKSLTPMKKRGECPKSTIAARRSYHNDLKVVEWPLWRCKK